MRILFHKIILTFLLLLITQIAAADTVVLATGAWLPYINKVGYEPKGYAVDVLNRVLFDAGCSVVTVNMPYVRALQGVYDGDIDVIIGVREDEIDADKVIKNQVPIGVNIFSFYVKGGNGWVYNGVESLAGKTLGLVAGEIYPELAGFLSISQNKKHVEFLSGDDAFGRNIKKLLAGRLDVILDNRFVIDYYVHQFDVEQTVRYAGDLGKPVNLYAIFSLHNPKSEEYARILDQGIRTMRANGELDKILAKYQTQDWTSH